MANPELVTEVIGSTVLRTAQRRNPVIVDGLDKVLEELGSITDSYLRQVVFRQVVEISTIYRDNRGWSVASVRVGEKLVPELVREVAATNVNHKIGY